MQACSLGGGESLGSYGQAPSVLASPNTKAKLLLLERRLTGSNHQPPHSTHNVEASSAKPAAVKEEQMLGIADGNAAAAKAAVEVVVIDGTQDDVQCELFPAATLAPFAAHEQHVAAPIPVLTPPSVIEGRKSPTPPATDLPTSANKRRKTSKPQHRPASADAVVSTNGLAIAADGIRPSISASGHASAAATAAPAGKDLTQQRDKSARLRASPRSAPATSADAKTATAAGADLGNSNPPMSPMSGGNAGAPMPIRTPRSSHKHSAQQHKGQQNISKFFPLLMDGNSRDSETASLQQQQQQQQHQQQQQQQQPSPHKDTVDQQRAATAAASGGITPPPASAAAAVDAAGSNPRPAKRSRISNSGQGSGGSDAAGVPAASVWQQQLAAAEQKHQQELEQLRQEARQHASHMSEQLSSSQRQAEALQGLVHQLQQELAAARSGREAREGVIQAALSQLVVQLAVAQGSLSRLQLSLDGSRLGNVGLARNGALGFAEVWEDGPILRDLATRKAALQRAREEVDIARKALKKRLPPPPKATLTADASCTDATHGSQYISSAEYVMQDEILKVRLAVLKREEELLTKEEERLNQEKMKHLRLLKRLRDEEASRFQGQPTLNQRYVLVSLLGRGGFSEVHRAYDLVALKFVAVKIHQLNSTWSESRKASYVRHAVREYTIHKVLQHTNIVTLKDIFEVDNTTFATVLELCEGGDLEGHLQQYHTLPEREARALIAQVFAGLAYLNRAPNSSNAAGGVAELGPRVIHYDLKPANILFDSLGTVKITDFGLSKVVEDGQTMGMELTSQGAGTYWYLPPECFQTGSSSSISAANASRGAAGLLPAGLLGSTAGGAAAAGVSHASSAPRISNKVDVWSAGVILYQMLYGRRPFGEGLTQEQIYRDGVMLNARQVQFPAKPAVSAEGRAFLQRCLAYNQEERWDVLTAAADPYLVLKR